MRPWNCKYVFQACSESVIINSLRFFALKDSFGSWGSFKAKTCSGQSSRVQLGWEKVGSHSTKGHIHPSVEGPQSSAHSENGCSAVSWPRPQLKQS